ncbi:MAG: hypothetical protein SVU88_03050 [Candidatus Nanohaloarchaea archaeon]|nr:hypothetical protein [Candidatus Nanohaloarchaea archaeon]
MQKLLVLLAVVLALTSVAAASSGFYSVNGSEPRFLRDIGPQDERTDEPLAAAVVAVAVAAVILRGLRQYED